MLLRALTAVSVLSVAASAQAATVSTLSAAVTPAWGVYDSAGTYTAAIDPTTSQDGDGSLRVSTTGTSGKVYVGSFGNFGSFSSIGSLSFDYRVDPANSGPAAAAAAPAFKVWVMNGLGQSASLTWERAYNDASANTPAGWQNDVNAGSGSFWLRYAGTNYDQIANLKTLAAWQNASLGGFTFDTNTVVTGFAFGHGSGINANFAANIDDFRYSVGANTDTVNFGAPVVPSPAAVSGGVALCGFLAARRKRSAAMA